MVGAGADDVGSVVVADGGGVAGEQAVKVISTIASKNPIVTNGVDLHTHFEHLFTHATIRRCPDPGPSLSPGKGHESANRPHESALQAVSGT